MWILGLDISSGCMTQEALGTVTEIACKPMCKGSHFTADIQGPCTVVVWPPEDLEGDWVHLWPQLALRHWDNLAGDRRPTACKGAGTWW